MRAARTLIAPPSLSSLPRTKSAGAERATFLYRSQMGTGQMTLTRPVSSSRLMKTTPLAVIGCCLWVTNPPTMTGFPLGSGVKLAAVITPSASRSLRNSSVG